MGSSYSTLQPVKLLISGIEFLSLHPADRQDARRSFKVGSDSSISFTLYIQFVIQGNLDTLSTRSLYPSLIFFEKNNTMPASQQKRLSRSKSCGRQPERELRSASTYANAHLSNRRKELSPARGYKLPVDEVNKEATEVSHNESVSLYASTESAESNIRVMDNKLPLASTSLQPGDPNSSERGTAPSGQVSDNRGSGFTISTPTSPTTEEGLDQLHQAKEDPARALLMVLAELKEIKSQMIELRKTEAVTASLVEQLAANKSKVNDLESRISKDETKVQHLNDNLADLKNRVAQQDTHFSELKSKVAKMGEDVTPLRTKVDQQEKKVDELKSFKDEVTGSSERAIECMNNLVDTQREQVDTFNAGVKRIGNEWKKEVLDEVEKRLKKMEKEKGKQCNKEVMNEVEQRFQKMENDRYCNSLKDQAYRNRFNLVIMGLPEEEGKSSIQIVKQFFSDTLQAKNIDVNSAARLGAQITNDNTQARPVLVKFNKLPQRNRIWRKRKNIPDDGTNSKIRLQADRPKALREGIQTLYRVVAAASKIKQFQNIKVQDFQLVLKDEIYQITDLENLPKQIRPSMLASPKSDSHMVFFSRHSKLSNHFPAKFTIN